MKRFEEAAKLPKLRDDEVDIIRRVKFKRENGDTSESITIRLGGQNAKDFDHLANGKIRNILANEFGLNKGNLGRESVAALVKHTSGEIIAKEVQERLKSDRSFQQMFESAVKLAAAEEVKRVFADKIEDAANALIFKMSFEEKPKDPKFGKF